MKIRRVVRNKAVIIACVAVVAVALVGAGVLALDRRVSAPKAKSVAAPTAPKPAEPTTSTTPTPPAPFNKALYSTTDPASLWVIVNKSHPLSPVSYTPSDLISAYGHQVSSRMVSDLTAMINAAATEGANITVVSSYRSYDYQVNLYNQYVATDGQAKADTYSARAGYSEHQTGLAIDFGNKSNTCPVEDCYADTTEGKWLAANAYKYGFLLRYTAAEQPVTGYEAEAWHYRYVGRGLTTEMHTYNILTLEAFFGVSGGDYAN